MNNFYHADFILTKMADKVAQFFVAIDRKLEKSRVLNIIEDLRFSDI
jgi:hypothetical protein